MTSLIYYQCTTYLSEEWFFTDSSVETATFTASAIDNTSLAVATQKSYELVIDQSFKYVNARYPDRTIARCVTTIKRDTNFNGDGNITAGLLELTGPFSNNDIPLKNTFDYYWDNAEKYNLPFKPFPIYDTTGTLEITLQLLESLYNAGYRIFVGFSRSTIVNGVLPWFQTHPDAMGISATSTAFSLVKEKSIYRMTPIDTGIQINLEENIKQNPTLSIYFMYQEGDFFSTDYLASFKKNPVINERLIVCTFTDEITTEQLNAYLVNAKTTDFIVNGIVDIEIGFLSVFENPGYTVKPYIYDSIGSKHPDFTAVQSENLKGNYSYFSYKGVNTSYLWRKGLEYLTNQNFSPLGFDTLQVQTQLTLNKNPDYLEGAAGILQFDPITKDRQYFSVLREDFSITKEWRIKSLIFDDPLLGNFVANKIV